MSEYFQTLQPVHFLPLLTTVFSAYFLYHIAGRYVERRSSHLLWWSVGVFTYGLGTFFESLITLFGNTPALNKLWYVAGAILGGYPLAQGSVYFHLRKTTAQILTAITLPFIVFAAIAVFLSPVNTDLLDAHRPGGVSLEWQWVRLLTPFINTYSAIFLIGSAFLSAFRYSKLDGGRARALGNTLIAVGAILPGIGGIMAKGGVVEALYVGEFIGITLIYLGYRLCAVSPVPAELEVVASRP
jgi:hypothetical protein